MIFLLFGKRYMFDTILRRINNILDLIPHS